MQHLPLFFFNFTRTYKGLLRWVRNTIQNNTRETLLQSLKQNFLHFTKQNCKNKADLHLKTK